MDMQRYPFNEDCNAVTQFQPEFILTDSHQVWPDAARHLIPARFKITVRDPADARFFHNGSSIPGIKYGTEWSTQVILGGSKAERNLLPGVHFRPVYKQGDRFRLRL